MGNRSRMQGTAWHYINRWELKPKDEFAWNEKEKPKKKKKKRNTNYVELTKQKSQQIKPNYRGHFTLKFEDEIDEQEYIIGENISKDAEILNKVFSTDAGNYFIINNEKILLVKKNIKN